jgi:hypothetical protein
MLIVVLTCGAEPPALLAITLNVVVAVMLPLIDCDVALEPPLHCHAVGAPPPEQETLRAKLYGAVCELPGTPMMLQPDGAAGGVFDQVTVNGGETLPGPMMLLPFTV